MPATYAAALGAAARIHANLARLPDGGGGLMATLPDAANLAVLLDAAFWTSLRREEVYTPRISMAFTSASQVKQPIFFSAPLSLDPRGLTKLAAAVERSGIHLCVHPRDGELQVWGISRQLPPLCVVVEIIVPGLLVVKQSPATETGKFLNIAVLQGDEVKIIDSDAGAPHRYPALDALLRRETPVSSDAVNVLLQLAVSIRAHGRGGILLVVPGSSEAWRESVVQPMAYEMTPPFAGLANLMRKDESGRATRKWEDALARAVDGIAGFTAVDGATVLTADYDLLAFGAKIVRRKAAQIVPQVVLTEPVEGGHPIITDA
ncbi:MAG: putative sensor domain DACNV-containing protein, partial [Acidobacteriota bacterium]